MALQDDLEVLVNFGVFNEDVISRMASFARTVQSLAQSGVLSPGPAPRPARGRPAGGRTPAGVPGRPAGQRAPRGSFNPSKDDLSKWKETMTAKEIAEKHGVSMATVNLRLKKLGLTTPRGKKGKK